MAASFLGGCTSGRPEAEPSADRVCVRVRQITSISALSDRHVLVKATGSGYSLFTVDVGCGGLSLARAIAIVEAGQRVCGDGFEFLSFRHPGVGVKRCRIVRIEPVADERAARALIESRPAP